MPFRWTEDQVGDNYKFETFFSNSVGKCPECCIGGSLMSNSYMLNNTIQMKCKQGIRVYYCTNTPVTTRLLTFACSETQLIRNILIENDDQPSIASPSLSSVSPPSSSSSPSLAISAGIPSSSPISPSNNKVPSISSHLNTPLIFPIFMIALYFYLFKIFK